MPQIIIEQPITEKLPPGLYDNAFKLMTFADRNDAIYLFHDGLWFANLPHMLGWAREIIHSLDSTWMRDIFQQRNLMADWLCGHAFQRVNDNQYRVSGTEKFLTPKELFGHAVVAQRAIEAADIHTDQWGSSDHEGWLKAIGTHLDRKRALVQEMRRSRKDIEVHTMLNNHANADHHPEYPRRGG